MNLMCKSTCQSRLKLFLRRTRWAALSVDMEARWVLEKIVHLIMKTCSRTLSTSWQIKIHSLDSNSHKLRTVQWGLMDSCSIRALQLVYLLIWVSYLSEDKSFQQLLTTSSAVWRRIMKAVGIASLLTPSSQTSTHSNNWQKLHLLKWKSSLRHSPGWTKKLINQHILKRKQGKREVEGCRIMDEKPQERFKDMVLVKESLWLQKLLRSRN